MAKRLVLTALRLLLLNIVAAVIVLFFLGIENAIVQISIESLFAVVLWIFVWLETAGKGQNDVKKDKIIKLKQQSPDAGQFTAEPLQFKPWFGFAAGALSQLPTIGVIVAYFIVDATTAESILKPVLNVMNINYVHISNMLNFFPFFYLIPSLVFITVAGLGYLNGPAQQRRLETIIERNKAKKAKRVQDDLKAKKAHPKKSGAKR